MKLERKQTNEQTPTLKLDSWKLPLDPAICCKKNTNNANSPKGLCCLLMLMFIFLREMVQESLFWDEETNVEGKMSDSDASSQSALRLGRGLKNSETVCTSLHPKTKAASMFPGKWSCYRSVLAARNILGFSCQYSLRISLAGQKTAFGL